MDLVDALNDHLAARPTQASLLRTAGLDVTRSSMAQWLTRRSRIPAPHVVPLLATVDAEHRAEVACDELRNRLAVTDLPDMLTRILGADDLLRASTAKALGITEATLRTWAAVAAGREA